MTMRDITTSDSAQTLRRILRMAGAVLTDTELAILINSVVEAGSAGAFGVWRSLLAAERERIAIPLGVLLDRDTLSDPNGIALVLIGASELITDHGLVDPSKVAKILSVYGINSDAAKKEVTNKIAALSQKGVIHAAEAVKALLPYIMDAAAAAAGYAIGQVPGAAVGLEFERYAVQKLLR
jgi:hypothetical protein